MALMPSLCPMSFKNKFTGMIPTLHVLKAVVPGSGISLFMRLLLDGNYMFEPILESSNRAQTGF